MKINVIIKMFFVEFQAYFTLISYNKFIIDFFPP